MAKFNKIVNEVTSRLSLHLFQYETLQKDYKDEINSLFASLGCSFQEVQKITMLSLD